MKKILKSDTYERKNSPVCSITEFPLNDHLIDFAIAKISGRYPDQDYVTNELCKEVVYVIEGKGELFVNGKDHLLAAGDTVLIEAGEKFCWNGNMSLAISCRPSWTKEQHKVVQ